MDMAGILLIFIDSKSCFYNLISFGLFSPLQWLSTSNHEYGHCTQPITDCNLMKPSNRTAWPKTSATRRVARMEKALWARNRKHQGNSIGNVPRQGFKNSRIVKHIHLTDRTHSCCDLQLDQFASLLAQSLQLQMWQFSNLFGFKLHGVAEVICFLPSVPVENNQHHLNFWNYWKLTKAYP